MGKHFDLKIGDIVLCVKDYSRKEENNWFLTNGAKYRVIRKDIEDCSYYIKSLDGHHGCWLRYDYHYITIDKLDYIWKYIQTKNQRADRIRDIAKTFIDD